MTVTTSLKSLPSKKKIMEDDTIVALSTPPGRGAIGIIKLSGSEAEPIFKELIEGIPGEITARKYYHGYLHSEGKRIAECLAVLFKTPRSFTGEDVVEISIYSNPFLIEEALLTAVKMGARMALPGEFTYRAFKNGKMDLIQAEAVNDLILANSRYFAHMEFDNLEGRLSAVVQEIRRDLIDLGTDIETAIEFQEDQHIRDLTIGANLPAAISRLESILGSSRFQELLNRGMNIVLAGKVNAGKSTLFNTLLMKERSIISSTPGTTRDYIQEQLHIDGFPFQITDMAGIQSRAGDSIEHQGIERSISLIEKCDAVIFMLDASRDIEPIDFEIYRLIGDKIKIMVLNKSDIAEPRQCEKAQGFFPGEIIHPLSAKNRNNLETVTSFLKGLLNDLREKNIEAVINFRQKSILENLLERLKKINRDLSGKSPDAAILAEEIRRSIHGIGELTGEIANADILQEIFQRFCIGK